MKNMGPKNMGLPTVDDLGATAPGQFNFKGDNVKAPISSSIIGSSLIVIIMISSSSSSSSSIV